ncbi:MAG: M1 family metallopeptidase, partial [Bacteroidia bacterium]|nr:M1 family metallopeptidase [Bacteroidia bacterium]
MLRSIFFLTLLFSSLISYGQTPASFISTQSAWQQHVDYKIEVTLNDVDHTLKAFETIIYTNNSPDILTYIPFHLWPNAYADNNTVFAKQLLAQGKLDFHFAPDSMRGNIAGLDFKVDGLSVKTEINEDICQLQLNKPLMPGETISISTPFIVKIPGQFSRLGHVGKSYQISQWYPKPAVYDINKWHAIHYLDQGEFYSEFGSFEVAITLPGDYTLAATGILQNEEDRMSNSKPTKTLTWKQDSIHDFAWFAAKNFIVETAEVTLPSGKKIKTWSYSLPSPDEEKDKNKKSINQSIEQALLYYSSRIGDYPYSTATAVIGPLIAGGGMEYPTITICQDDDKDVIVHEVGHNWFYGALGSNERDHPWMDEGLNSYYEMGATNQMEIKEPFKYRRLSKNLNYQNTFNEHYFLYLFQARLNEDQACNLTSEDYSEINFGAIVYSKTALLLNYLCNYLGQPLYDSCMKQYYK